MDLWIQFISAEIIIQKEKNDINYLTRRYHKNLETSTHTIIVWTNDADQSKYSCFVDRRSVSKKSKPERKSSPNPKT